MRKALIAAAVATALFAVGAFAASFAVQSEDVASGGNAVTACATNVDIDFDAPELESDGTWSVDTATVRFVTSTGAAVDDTCDGFDVDLALATGVSPPGTWATAGTGTVLEVDNNASTIDIDIAETNVAVIHGASVVVDGKTLTADL